MANVLLHILAPHKSFWLLVSRNFYLLKIKKSLLPERILRGIDFGFQMNVVDVANGIALNENGTRKVWSF